MNTKNKEHIREINKIVQKWGDSPSDPPIEAIKAAREALDCYILDYTFPHESAKMKEFLKLIDQWLEEFEQ